MNIDMSADTRQKFCLSLVRFVLSILGRFCCYKWYLFFSKPGVMVQAFNPSTQEAGLYSEISQVVSFSPIFVPIIYMEMQFEFYVLSLYLAYTLDKFTFFLEMCAHSESQLYILSIFVSNLPALSDLHSIH